MTSHTKFRVSLHLQKGDFSANGWNMCKKMFSLYSIYCCKEPNDPVTWCLRAPEGEMWTGKVDLVAFWSKVAFLMVQRSRTMSFMFPIAVCEVNWQTVIGCPCYRWIVSLWYGIIITTFCFPLVPGSVNLPVCFVDPWSGSVEVRVRVNSPCPWSSFPWSLSLAAFLFSSFAIGL